MCKIRYSQLFQYFIVFLSLLLNACSDEGLEEKLNLIEQRVLNETVFGRQMQDFMKSKNTRYIIDPNLISQARYSIADDSIHYNPTLNPPLKQWRKEILGDDP